MNINATTLKLVREKRNLTQEALAIKSGISKKNISRIESSTTRNHRNRTIKLLAKALDIREEDLCRSPDESADKVTDTSESAYRKLTTHLSPEANLAFAFVEERYGVSSEDLIEMAPLLFTLLAEASLNWRREKLKQAEDAFDRLSRLGAALPHLSFCGGPRRDEDMLDIEQSCIDQGDVFGSQLKVEAKRFGGIEPPGNPFARYLALLAAKHARDLIEVEQYDPDAALPSYMIRTDKIERLTGGDDRARYALAHGYGLRRDIPAELLGDDAKERRVAWLAKRVPEEEWTKHQAAKTDLRAFLEELGI